MSPKCIRVAERLRLNAHDGQEGERTPISDLFLNFFLEFFISMDEFRMFFSLSPKFGPKLFCIRDYNFCANGSTTHSA